MNGNDRGRRAAARCGEALKALDAPSLTPEEEALFDAQRAEADAQAWERISGPSPQLPLLGGH